VLAISSNKSHCLTLHFIKLTRITGSKGSHVHCWIVSNSSPVHVFEQLFWTGQMLNNIRLKDWAIFHGSIFRADPRAPDHLMLCL